MTIDQIAYWLKRNCRPLFEVVELVAGCATAFWHRRAIRETLEQAPLDGTIKGKTAKIRVLEPQDLNELLAFFSTLPEDRFTFFRPHGFSRSDLSKVLRRPYYIAYGLFIDDKIQGYSLFKLYPGRKVFFGRILPKSLTGCGLGKILSLYLQWQSRLLGFRMRGTINLKNLPSVASHKAVGGFSILGDLPNGYTLIEFPLDSLPKSPPKLEVPLQ